MLEDIKICVVTTVPLTIKSFLLEQLKYLSRHGFRITVVCDEDSELSALCSPELVYIPVRMSRDARIWGTIISFIHLFKVLRNGDFQMVQYATPKAALLSSLAAFLAGIRIRLYSQWGIRYVGLNGINRRLFKLLEKTTCRLSTHICPDSFGNLAFAIDEGLYPASKGGVVFKGSANGVDMKRFDISCRDSWREIIRSELNIPGDAFVYGFVGRINRDKGVSELLEAYSKIIENESDTYLIMIGPMDADSDLDVFFRETVKSQPSVIWLGPRNDPEKCLAAMDLVVLPTYREGFGIVAIEAQAMGVPVLTTDVPGPREAVLDGSTGILIPPRDSERLFYAMKEMKKDKVNLELMGKKGFDYVKENFNQEVFWEKTLVHRRKIISDIIATDS